MEYFKQSAKYKPNKFFLKYYLEKYWFIPSDVLQRGMEANIWNLCRFKHPILDIGVGNGEQSTLLFKRHAQMDVGIDIDESGLESARATNKYKKVLCANAEKTPFKDASFNTVVSNSTFEHITYDLKAVSEVGRVLKKGGLFFLTVPSEYLQDWILEYETEKNKENALKQLEVFNSRTVHLHYRSIEKWKKVLANNNMEIVFYKYYLPKDIALYWYKMLKFSVYKVRNRELWSYFGHSKLTRIIPKQLLSTILERKILKSAYEKGFFTTSEPGGQLFLIAKKK